MTSSDLAIDALGRIRDVARRVVDGLTPEQLSFRVDPGANTIAWLVWHLTRVQDDHIAELANAEQIWSSGGWVDRFGLPFDRFSTGFGHSPEEVAAVRVPSVDLLSGYHDAVFEQSLRFLEGLTDADFDRIVDESWEPPVTLGVRLVSVISDGLQHAGQAALLRGTLERR